MAGPITPDLIQTLVRQELQHTPPKPSFDLGLGPAPKPSTPLNPERLATMGALADIAGTYAGLKTHRANEGNAMLSGMKPEGVALGLFAQLLAQKGATALIRKFSPGTANAIAANQGAEQLGLGAGWGGILNGQSHPDTGHARVRAAQQRSQLRETARLREK